MMLTLYSLFFYLLSPFLVIRLWLKSLKNPAYRHGISARFGFYGVPKLSVDIWVHAVSLGETIAASPLIDDLIEQNKIILITHMTPTGLAHATKKWGNKVLHVYIPYDIPFSVKRFYQQFQPRLGVIMETEIWPNLISHAHELDIPLLLINARLSERSYKNYEKYRYFFKPILEKLTVILAQAHPDAERFRQLGAPVAIVHTIGNIKFDLNMNEHIPIRFLSLKKAWGEHRPVVIFASTHDKEEIEILPSIKALKAAIPNVLCIFAPRHSERFNVVFNLIKDKGYKTERKSQPDMISEETEVIILDTLGELVDFYAVCHIAFVGGSLVPIGGHNVLEPISRDVPTITGPHCQNFATINQDLLSANALIKVHNTDELTDELIELFKTPQKMRALSKNAMDVLKKNQGVLKHYLHYIDSFLRT